MQTLPERPDTNTTPTHDGYPDVQPLAAVHVCDQSPEWQAEFHRAMQDLELSNSQERYHRRDISMYGVSTPHYRKIRRPHCKAPKGLKLKDRANPGRVAYPIVACQLCSACKAWNRQLDRVRILETITKPVWFVIEEHLWESYRHKLNVYHSAPLPDDRRAVITEAGAGGETIENLDDLLASFDEQRDRGRGRSGRRVSTGGMESRKALEKRISAAQDDTEADPTPTREWEIVGVFAPHDFMRSGRHIWESVDWMGALCDSLGIEHTRNNIGIEVATEDTAVLDRVLRVKWSRGTWTPGDPPPPDETWADMLAETEYRQGMVFDEPPIESYVEAA